MKKLLVVIGMPGSGKDTQIDYMSKRRKLNVIRIGDLVRAKAKSNPDIEEDLESGDLVDNDVVNDLVSHAINSVPDGSYLISDGFPRDIGQAKWLDTFVANHDVIIDKVLLIDIDNDVSVDRLSKRGRDDDDSKTIQHRLEVFHTETDKVIDYYKADDRLSIVNGEPSPEVVSAEIEKILGW